MLPNIKFADSDRKKINTFGEVLKRFMNEAQKPSAMQNLLKGQPQKKCRVLSDIPQDLLRYLEGFGLVAAESNVIKPLFQAKLIDGNIVFSDLLKSMRRVRHSSISDAYVDPLWEGPIMSNLLVRNSADSALDMGCGSVVLAMSMASFANHVVAVDLNPRAIQFTRFNAMLNGLNNIEAIHSSLFSDLKGRRFDLITFNAPVGTEISPSNLLEAGEPILTSFFEKLADHLQNDGTCIVNLCFKDFAGSLFFDRVREWLANDADTYRFIFLEKWRNDSGLKFGIRKAICRFMNRDKGSLVSISRGLLFVRRSNGLPSLKFSTPYSDWAPQLGPDFGSSFVQMAFSVNPESLGPDSTKSSEFASEPYREYKGIGKRVVRKFVSEAECL